MHREVRLEGFGVEPVGGIAEESGGVVDQQIKRTECVGDSLDKG